MRRLRLRGTALRPRGLGRTTLPDWAEQERPLSTAIRFALLSAFPLRTDHFSLFHSASPTDHCRLITRHPAFSIRANSRPFAV